MNRRDFFKRSVAATSAATVMPTEAKTHKDSADIKRFVSDGGSVVVDWKEKHIEVKGEILLTDFHTQMMDYLFLDGADYDQPYWPVTNNPSGVNTIQLTEGWTITNPNGLLKCVLHSEDYTSFQFACMGDASKGVIYINGSRIYPNSSGIFITDFIAYTMKPIKITSVTDSSLQAFEVGEFNNGNIHYVPILVD